MEATVVLCDYAQVWQGKLFVSGAAINIAGVADAEPPHRVSLYAGVMITVPWTAHNQMHRLRVSLLDEDDNVMRIASAAPGIEISEEDDGRVLAQFNAGRAPIMQAGDDSIIPLAVQLAPELPKLGGYTVVVDIDRTEVARARFRVLHGLVAGSAAGM